MKSVFNATVQQNIMGESSYNATIGFIYTGRVNNTNNLVYYYTNGTSQQAFTSSNFFQNLDNQWLHIIVVCDYTNKTAKAYRNGVQFQNTQNHTGTPQFPSVNRVKYVGSYNQSQFRLTDGSLDEVRIYNRGLSEDEVMAIYNQTKSNYE